jgi:hypothetical protein
MEDSYFIEVYANVAFILSVPTVGFVRSTPY